MEQTDYQKELERCVRCGACKAQCPTYLEGLDECLSARGRLAMLSAFEAGRLRQSRGLMEKLFSCLLCGACQKRCSPNVPIQDILYHSRQKFSSQYQRNHLLAGLTKLALSYTDTAAACFRGLQHIAELSPVEIDSFLTLPPVAKVPFLKRDRATASEKTKKVAVFTGCTVNYLYPHLGESLVHVLSCLGYQAVVLYDEVCCGAPLRSLGLEQEAQTYMEHNMGLLRSLDCDVLVTLCPTCTWTLKSVAGFDKKSVSILDINEFLVHESMELAFAIPQKAVYHDPCHLKNKLNVFKEPRAILSTIQGLELLEAEQEGCCGFGGIFRIEFPELSMKIGQKRFAVLMDSGAHTIITSCLGCIMQFEDITKRNLMPIRIKHIIELVDETLKMRQKAQ
ncbi:MAG TPA: (Fe-S)-binding protein [Thermodesulfovibrionia bacterium]|nr:(Fe-S)-binding protein [Thermodesulfovibrionia bacterium]